MRDVVKTNVKRNQSSKRVRRRRRNIPAYTFLVVIFVIGIGILLSVTLFFNIETINVNGDVDYSKEEIIRVSGIDSGDNMVRLNAKAAEENILRSMVFIESVDIEKQYPDTLQISVSRCIPSVNVECEGGYLLISKKGKMLEKVDTPDNKLVIVKGFEPSNETLGAYIESMDEQKTEIYYELFEAISKNEKSKVKTIDLSDKYEILVNFDNRIEFELGNSNDISYKINLAETVLKDLGDDKKGTMTMVGSNQISFRSNSDSTKPETYTKIPIESTISSEDSEESEDEYVEEYYNEDYYDDNYEENLDYYDDVNDENYVE